jgi:1,4-alpha-glucan branching enzyme
MSMNKTPKKTKSTKVSTVATVATAKAAAPVSTPTPAPVKSAAATSKPTIGQISLELVKPEAKQVYVAGDFNGWTPEKTPLMRKPDGRWVGDLKVNPGRHEYLFVVDGQWVPDPNAKEAVQNPFGGLNSILTVSA